MPKLPSSFRRPARPWLRRAGWSPARLAVATLALLLAAPSIVAALAQGFGPAGPSPASGAAAVVAHGVVTLNEGNGRWHLTELTAETNAAPFDISVPGFIVAEGTPILVTDLASGERTRLAGGEAMMVRPGDRVTAETFGAPDSFLFIQLATGDQQPLATGTRSVYTSAGFPVTATERDVDLVRGVIAEGEAMVLPAGAVPTAVYVFRGEVAVASANDETNLRAGEAGTFAGDFQIQAIADGSIVYVAFVGASVPATTSQATPAAPASTPIATPAATPAPATPLATPASTPLPPPPEPTAAPTQPPVDTADDDGDGLTNTREAELATDPANPDTDADGISDGDEVNVYLTNAFIQDTDADLLYEGGELVYGSGVLNPDSDSDGLLDGAEVYTYETNPIVADTDGDGASDGAEVSSGTNPLDPQSVP